MSGMLVGEVVERHATHLIVLGVSAQGYLRQCGMNQRLPSCQKSPSALILFVHFVPLAGRGRGGEPRYEHL